MHIFNGTSLRLLLSLGKHARKSSQSKKQPISAIERSFAAE